MRASGMAVRYASGMENMFQLYKPDIVFHAAAYKHVPVMESQPSEAICNNVLGTRILADLAVKYVDKTKPETSGRILPWLTPDKYSYTIISKSNLDVLQYTKDVDSYKKLIEKVLPGKF